MDSFAPSVLLVDDESDVVEEARHVLERAGLAVKTAKSGKAALGFIEHERPHLVITDVSLLDAAGVDVLRAVRAMNPAAPVIVLTAHGQLAEARLAVQQGAFHYIQKPFAPEELLLLCKRALENLELKLENARLRKVTSNATMGVSDKVRFSPRPERAAMERAALVRVTQFIGDAVTKASTNVLEQALGEPAPDEALVDVLGETLVRDATGGEWAAALLRGAKVQRDLLQQAGGGLSSSQVGNLLGISRAAVDKRRRQGALLGLKLPSGVFVYPSAQFEKNDVLPGLPDVLSAFHVEDPWMQLDALLARDEALRGRSPFKALADGDVERVKAVVSSYGKQGL